MCKALEKLEEKGRQEGELKTKLKLIIKKIHKNKSFDQIVDELEENADVVQERFEKLGYQTENVEKMAVCHKE